MTVISLFPLSSVVLPEGKMRLKVFEPRYLRMISECCQTNAGFGLGLVDRYTEPTVQKLPQLGTYVEIDDFEVLPDGLLGISVAGKRRFTIKRIWVESDGLRKAEVEWLRNWEPNQLRLTNLVLANTLEQVYRAFPVLAGLNPDTRFDDASWVCQRWLEILPLAQSQFERLSGYPDCSEAIRFLSRVLENPSQYWRWEDE